MPSHIANELPSRGSKLGIVDPLSQLLGSCSIVSSLPLKRPAQLHRVSRECCHGLNSISPKILGSNPCDLCLKPPIPIVSHACNPTGEAEFEATEGYIL